MEITRLNADSSWLIKLGDLRFLLDPWLLGPQIDGVSWFSKQWHALPCVSVKEIGKIDGIVISHPFTDHCHKETLLQFPEETPIWASPSAAKTIRSWKHFHIVYAIGTKLTLNIGKMSLTLFQGSGIFDLVHDALLISDSESGENVFYAPHGFKEIQKLGNIEKTTVLITTTIAYKLPFWLGGTVNLGKENATKLATKLKPKYLIYTHNEHKHAEGLVSKIARPDWDEKLELPNISVLHPELSKPLYLN